MKEIKAIKITDWEIDELIRNLGIDGYNCVEFNEWDKGTYYLAQGINADNLEKHVVKEIEESIKFNVMCYLPTRLILCYLAKLGDISSGDYLVEVCW